MATKANYKLDEIGAGKVGSPRTGEAVTNTRAIIEAAGIRDIRTKSLRSNNPCNVAKATIEGLKALRNVADVAAIRGKTVEEILG